jgi:hypothetical protein
MFSVIQSHYHAGIEENVPAVVQQNPQMSEALSDPQFLVNTEALEGTEAGFAQFGENGEALFAETLTGARVSLADGIAEAFFIAIFVLAAAVVVGAFLKEEPMRRTHAEPASADTVLPPLTPVDSPLPPLAGGANGHDKPG